MKLIIVESPAKSKTILKCLGKGYDIVATMGHIRDLPKSKLGIDIEKDFTPTYGTIRGKGKAIKALRTKAKAADEIYLAVDLDREGEAIAWHVTELLKFPKNKTHRVTFNEITPQAIKKAFKNPGKLNLDKVNAQQARRLLDRLVGYKLSPLLWKKIAKGLSAGRVQSVAVRVIVEREKQIQAFTPQEYWEINAALRSAEGQEPFDSILYRIKGKKPQIANEKDATTLVNDLKERAFTVTTIDKKRTNKKAPPPFTTSLLQQQASVRLRFSTKKTMRIAQQLYEGIEIGGEGPVGLITYMRTDSFHIAPTAISEVRSYIETTFSKKHLPSKPNTYTSKKQAQEAHEAIRPTSVQKTPEDMAKYLDKNQLSLYEIIWRQFVASQMSPAVFDITNVLVDAGDCTFRAKGRQMVFEGHTAVQGIIAKKEDQLLPPMEEGQELTAENITPRQCFTKPPPRYSEATLVKILERKGIGRPSTYSPIISTIIDRGYVELQSRLFHATELGILVTDKLVAYFDDIINVEFTSSMEESLDKIEEGQADWVEILKKFYVPFEKDLENAAENMESAKGAAAETDETCPECKQPLVVRWGRGGKFIGCSGFPDCKFTKSIDGDDEEITEMMESEPPCEKCGSKMVIKSGRRGKFIACSGYPECKNTRSLPTKYSCPKEGCDGKVVERHSKQGRRFFGCSKYPDCDFTINKIPEEWSESESDEKS